MILLEKLVHHDMVDHSNYFYHNLKMNYLHIYYSFFFLFQIRLKYFKDLCFLSTGDLVFRGRLLPQTTMHLLI